MKNPVLRLIDAETGEGIEAPVSSLTYSELREAMLALLDAALLKGWIVGQSPSTDLMATAFDYQNRRPHG